MIHSLCALGLFFGPNSFRLMCHSASQSSALKTERQFILVDGGSEEAWIAFKIIIHLERDGLKFPLRLHFFTGSRGKNLEKELHFCFNLIYFCKSDAKIIFKNTACREEMQRVNCIFPLGAIARRRRWDARAFCNLNFETLRLLFCSE